MRKYEYTLAEILYRYWRDMLNPKNLQSIVCRDVESFIKHLCSVDVSTICQYFLLIDENKKMNLQQQLFIDNVVFSVIGKPWCVREEERIINSYIQ